MLIPHGAHILVCDGGHMQLLRNAGRELEPRLEPIAERALKNPATHVLSDDAPGRRFESAGVGGSAYVTVDEHQKREDAFGADALALTAARIEPDTPLIVIAPPRMLGLLRKRMPASLARQVIREFDKDIAHRKPQDVAAFLKRQA